MSEGKFGEPWSLVRVPCFEEVHNVVTHEGFAAFDQIEDQPETHRVVACVNALAGIDDPAAYIKALEKDRERLDWLCKHGDLRHDPDYGEGQDWIASNRTTGVEGVALRGEPREAIDAAMAGEGEGDGGA